MVHNTARPEGLGISAPSTTAARMQKDMRTENLARRRRLAEQRVKVMSSEEAERQAQHEDRTAREAERWRYLMAQRDAARQKLKAREAERRFVRAAGVLHPSFWLPKPFSCPVQPAPCCRQGYSRK